MANYLKEAEWADFEMYIDGVKVTGVKAISYTEMDEDEFIYGAGRKPIGLQTGNTGYEGSITVYKNEIDAMNIAAKAAGYESIKDVPNLVLVAVYKPKAGRLLKTDTITGAKISSLPVGWEQSAKAMEHQLPFKFLDIIRS